MKTLSVTLFVVSWVTYTSGSADQRCGIMPPLEPNLCLPPTYLQGNSVIAQQYPWYVALLRTDQPEHMVFCGATLITAIHLLTMAVCVRDSYKIVPVFILNDTCHDGMYASKSSISSVVVHPDYYKYPHDGIAVVTLQSPVPFTPACLPAPSSYTSEGEAVLLTRGMLEGFSSPCHLQLFNMRMYSLDECLRMKVGQGISNVQNMFCASFAYRGPKEMCWGISGSPLMKKIGTRYVLQGILSGGGACGSWYPNFHANVSLHIDWIRNVTSLPSTSLFPSLGTDTTQETTNSK